MPADVYLRATPRAFKRGPARAMYLDLRRTRKKSILSKLQ